MNSNEDFVYRFKKFLGIVMALVHIYYLGIKPINPWILLHIHLALGATIGILNNPIKLKYLGDRSKILNVMTTILPFMAALYFIFEADTIPYRVVVAPNLYDTIFSLIIIIYVLEVTRRAMGLTLPIVAIIFLLYARYGAILPGVLGHKGYKWATIISQSTSTSGIFGVSLIASAYYVFLLVLFSSFLRVAGMEKFLIDFSCAIAGRQRGGPAKIAIIASALFGTISGSSAANVVATGSFTIPMMKEIGYKPRFAAAVEAVASTGGQIMPPIMGSAVFIMIELINVTYNKIMAAAIIPAILYFLAVFLMVDLQAAKDNLACLQEKDIPNFKKVIKQQGYFIFPLFVLIFSLVALRTSVIKAALLGIIAILVVSILNRDNFMRITKILEAFYVGAIGSIDIILACACAGIVVGIILLTGLGFKVSEMILLLAGGNLYLTLIFAALTALILGMGVPTTASYLICAAVVAPAIIKLGVSPLASHLFVFYFACLSAITPPVALAVFAGAGIAKANPMSVAYDSVKLGFIAYLVPFVFAAGGTEIILEKGNMGSVIFSVITAIIGVMALAVALQGWIWFREKAIGSIERILFFIAALLTIIPGLVTDILGIILLIFTFLIGYLPDVLKHKMTN